MSQNIETQIVSPSVQAFYEGESYPNQTTFDVFEIESTADHIIEDAVENGGKYDKLYYCVLKNDEYRTKVNWSYILQKVQATHNKQFVVESKPVSLEDRLKVFLMANPSSVARDILKEFKKATPEITKTEINSLLYKMKGKMFIASNDPAPKWSVM
jgi:hypothetical protein